MSKGSKQKQFEDIIMQRLDRLESAVFGVKIGSKLIKRSIDNSVEINFDMPIRAFIKKYAKDKSGPKKFTLLLSWFSKGDLERGVPLKELEKSWNRMTAKSLLDGKFNRFYPAQAREQDWVDLRKKGGYNLRPDWRNIFNEKKSAKK